MRRFPRIRGAGYALVIVFVSISSGCALTATQKEAVALFSAATVELAEITEHELLELRNATIRMRSCSVVLLRDPVSDRLEEGASEGSEDAPSDLPTADSAPPLDDDLAQGFTLDRLEPRLQALTALRTYGELLLSLVEDTQQEELEEAADAFRQSIRDLPTEYRALSDAQLGAISEITITLGGLVVEAKKANAVRRIVRKTAGQVECLCGLLAEELATNEEHAREGLLLLDFDMTMGEFKDAIDNTFDEHGDDAILALRLAELKQEAQLYRDHRQTAGIRIHDALAKMQTANNHLGWQIDSPAFTSDNVEEFAKAVASLVRTVRIINSASE